MNKLECQWSFTESSADQFSNPESITNNQLWQDAVVPGTVATSQQQLGLWNIEENTDFDTPDWWYKSQFSITSSNKDQRTYINFDGLASLCEIWLNNTLLLTTDNMFREYQIDITEHIQSSNTLYLCFRSLNHYLKIKRPRPSWKTRLVKNQQLRWVRTTLLGKIPGWTPPVSAVGPWKDISIHHGNIIRNVHIQSKALSESQGEIEFSCNYTNNIQSVTKAILHIGEYQCELNVTHNKNTALLNGSLNMNDIKLWMPHTHGTPHTYKTSLTVFSDAEETQFKLTSIGFKNSSLDMEDDKFSISLNNKNIFCRGAVWTTNDITSLIGNTDNLRKTLTLMRDAGANMIRIGGTMCYETDDFYNICDEFGIMVWQDFMFANMDYPIKDEDFLNTVTEEIKQQVCRLAQHPCMTLYCGNSEIQQQVSMLGLSNESFQNKLFDNLIPEICHENHPNTPYIPSTPTGGVLPIHTDKNLSHYYGVGAYLADVSELRRHNVKFTSECLGFSNLPVYDNRNAVLDGENPVFHDPKWKRHTPRDSSAGWDFEDIRDHYLQKMYSIDPVSTRSYDSETYIKYSEVCSGEIMAQAFSEWRSQYSNCKGALVWFLKDLWSGAGWGIIDSSNNPKACYYYLKRNWQPISLHITNESLNGLHIHCNNENSTDFSGKLKLDIINDDYEIMDSAEIDISVNSNSIETIDSSSLFKRFFDIGYNYKFGPQVCLAATVSLKDTNGNLICDTTQLLKKQTLHRTSAANIDLTTTKENESDYTIRIKSDKFLYAICIESKDSSLSDNYFSLLPNTEKTISLTTSSKKLKAYFSALNINNEIRIKVNAE